MKTCLCEDIVSSCIDNGKWEVDNRDENSCFYVYTSGTLLIGMSFQSVIYIFLEVLKIIIICIFILYINLILFIYIFIVCQLKCYLYV